MPPGPRKRKSGRRKKGKGASIAKNPTTSTSNQPHGDEDPKQQGSESGEVSEYILTEASEEDVENRRVENRAVSEEGDFQVASESKKDDGFDKKKEGSSKRSSSSSSSDDESRVVEKDIPIIENAPIVDFAEAVDSCSKGPSQPAETVPVREFETLVGKAPVLDEKGVGDSGASREKSYDLENGGSKLSAVEGNGGVAPESREDEGIDAAATLEAKEFAGCENEEKLTVSYNPPLRDDANKDGEHVKDSENLGSSERQPLIAPVVQPVQRTSWKGCCGLCELFIGSNA